MKNVRLPEGASVTMSRDDVASLSKGSGVGGVVLCLAIAVLLFGGNDKTPTDKTPDTNPTRPSVSQTVDAHR